MVKRVDFYDDYGPQEKLDGEYVLFTDYDALEKERDELKASMKCCPHCKKLEGLTQSNDAMREYLDHKNGCRNKLYKHGWTCTCGFRDLLAAIQKEEKGD